MTDAALVVALANARAHRRPAHSPAVVAHDALADAASATELLEPFLDRRVGAHELATVRAVQHTVVAIVDALVDRLEPPLEELNALAAREPATLALERGLDGGIRTALRSRRASLAGALLLVVTHELCELEPSRLRRCARPQCGLIFYDVTRSSTQRWHAENPCGLRERQRRHRARHAAGSSQREVRPAGVGGRA